MNKSKRLMAVLLVFGILTLVTTLLLKDYFYIKVVLPGRWHPGRWCSESRMKAVVEHLAQSKKSINYCVSNANDYWCFVVLQRVNEQGDPKYKDYAHNKLLHAVSMADSYRQIFLYMLLYEYDAQWEYAFNLFLLVKDKPAFCSFSYAHSLGREFLAKIIDISVVSPALDADFKMVDVPLTEEEFVKMYNEKVPNHVR